MPADTPADSPSDKQPGAPSDLPAQNPGRYTATVRPGPPLAVKKRRLEV